MTSTNFNVGLDSTSRLTSRVLKPPGGGHTDIFGATEPELPRGRRHQASSIVLGNENEPQKATNGDSNSEQSNIESAQIGEPAAVDVVPTPAETKPAPAAAEPPKAEPQRRVRVPPGGFSSGLW